MKIFRTLMVLAPVFLLAACLAAGSAPDDSFKTLRLLSVDKNTSTAFYVPIRAVITGPGNATAPIALEAGKDRIVQGMIGLVEDPAELEKLTNDLKKQHGAEITVKKELTANVTMKVTAGDQVVWEKQIFSGSQGMPFQVMVPVDASATMKIQMRFLPASQGQTSATTMSFSQTRTISASNGTGSGSESLIATFSSLQDNAGPAEFEIEQAFEF